MRLKLRVLALLLAAVAVPAFGQSKHDEQPLKNLYVDMPSAELGGGGQIVVISKQVINDFQCIPTPGNPPTGVVRLYCDSGTGNMTCLTSAGAACISGGGGGTGTVTNTLGALTLNNFILGNGGADIKDSGFSIAPPLNGGTGVANPTIHTTPQAEGASAFNFVANGLTGQTFTAVNGADSVYKSPGISGTDVNAATYTVQCDSGTALIDRLTTKRFITTAPTVTFPDPTTSGCGGNFSVRLIAAGVTVTVNRTSTAVFNIDDGSTDLQGQTTFNLTTGQSALISSPDNANWLVQKNSGGGGGGTPCITTANSMQYNNAGAFGCTINLTSNGTNALFTAIAAPASPSAGFLVPFEDSTDLRFHDKNAAGTIGTTVVSDTGASNNFLTAISAAGVISKAQPAFSNLSGNITAAQMLALSSANIYVGNGSNLPVGVAASGDVTLGNTGIFTVTQVEGAAIPASAFFVGTSASKQLVADQPYVVNPQTTTYQVVAADFTGCKTITVASGTFTVTLVASGTQPATGQCINIFNYGSGVVTIARSGQNINGVAANLTLNAGSASAPTSANIVSNGTDYFATLDQGTVGTVTSVATTGPISGGTITSSGTISCPTCVTSSGGGAMTATAPVTVSAAGLIAISGVTGEQGNGALLQLSTGTVNSGRITKFDANGNTINSDFANLTANILNSPATTQSLIYQGGQDASANSILGNATLRGANQTGAGGATSAGGGAVVLGGTNAGTTAASQAGSTEIFSGSSTAGGLQGLLVGGTFYVKGGGTTTLWNLQCLVAATAMTVNDCGATPETWLGIAETTGVVIQLVEPSISQVPINASAAVTLGHTVCAGATAGKVTDSGGTTTCTNAQGSQVGVVIATSGTWTLPDGVSFTATTTLPLIQTNTAQRASAGGGTPCTTTALSIQYNNGGAFGCLAEFTYASSTITASAAGKIDLSATTGSSAFRTQVLAGAAPALNGAIAYDSTNNMFHGGLNSADSKFASFTVTPAANNNCVKWVVSGSNFLLGDAGAACLGGISSVVSVTPVTAAAAVSTDQQLMELSLPAGFLNTLKQPFWFNAAGVYSTAASQTPTLTFKIKLCTVSGCGSGTVVTLASIVTTAALASVTNDNWNLNILGATAATGATGNLEAHGHLSVDLGALTTTPDSIFNDVNTAVSANIDLTAALFVDFTVAESTASTTVTITERIGAVMPQTNPTGAGAASTSMALGSGSGTAGQLACVTSSNTMGNCTALPPNNFLGVFLPGGTAYATTGIVSVVIDATQNVTFGDILCASTTAGKSHDNLTVACANGEWVGTVTTTASSVSTVTASLRLQ